MGRQLKYHEQKLLKKVNLHDHGADEQHINKIVNRYRLSGKEEYMKYARIVGHMRQTADRLKALPPNDAERISMTQVLVRRCYEMGLIQSVEAGLEAVATVTVAKFCIRRLPVVMSGTHMAPSINTAIELVEQGHVRIGPHVVSDPALLVSRANEDLLAWGVRSKIKEQIATYNDQRDDYIMD